jgi:hypothetical protein
LSDEMTTKDGGEQQRSDGSIVCPSAEQSIVRTVSPWSGAVCGMLPPMTTRPTKDQISDALTRAAKAAQEHTKYPSRVLKSQLPKYASERRGERWWFIGHIRVLGEAEEWDVLYDPVTDQGRLVKIAPR